MCSHAPARVACRAARVHQADVFKALALGADGVVIARPFVTAVYGGEKEGVRSYIEKIGSELEDTMKMCGVSSLNEINRDCVFVG